MIQITGGVYGLRTTKGSITYKTERDEPFSLSAAEEKRLVRRGVAQYVEESKVVEPKTDVTETPQNSIPPDTKLPDGKAEPEELVLSEDMKLSDIKDIAATYGLDCSKMRSKAEVIDAIRDITDKPKENDDAPELGAAEPQA